MTTDSATATVEPELSAAPPPRRSAGPWCATRCAARPRLHHAPIGRAILLLAVPMVLEMAMESVFAVADMFWVAQLGPEAVATVGLTESMMTHHLHARMGLSIGATALVARRIGEKDPDGAARAAVQSIALGVVVAAVLGRRRAPGSRRAAAR